MRLQIRILKSVCNVVKSVARFTNLFHKLKTLSIYNKNIVDFISVIILA